MSELGRFRSQLWAMERELETLLATDPLRARIQELETENLRLSEKIVELEEALHAPDCIAPNDWGLTGFQDRIFSILVSREKASTAALITGCYGAADGFRSGGTIKVLICRMRKKLQPRGITIETSQHGYYYIPREQREGFLIKHSPHRLVLNRKAIQRA